MRNERITIAKGMAIILMVVAHAGIWGYANDVINMFHMPLFFLCSGYCFKEKYLDDFKGFAQRRVNGVWWPFVKYGLIFIALHNVFFHLNIYNGEYGFMGETSVLYEWKDFLKKAGALVVLRGNEQLLGGYWFLHTMFFGWFIAYFVIKFVRNRVVGLCGLLAVSAGLAASGFEVPVLRIEVKETMAAAFMLAGYMAAKNEGKIRIWLVVMMAAMVCAGAYWMPKSMLSLCEGWDAVYYFAMAVCGSAVMWMVAQWIDGTGVVKKGMVYVGNHTLEILTWHMLAFKIVSAVVICAEGREWAQLACFPVIAEWTDEHYYTPWWGLYFVVGLGVPLGMVWAKEKVVALWERRGQRRGEMREES